MTQNFFLTLVAGFLAFKLSVPLSALDSPMGRSLLDAVNVAAPIEGLLVGGQPSQTDLLKIKALGFQTIISLRTLEEDLATIDFDEKIEAEKLGIKFIRIPIVDTSDLTEKTLKLLDETLAAAGGRAFLHCSTGNKVGAALAMRAFRMQNKTYSEAIELGSKAGLTGNMKTTVQNTLQATSDSQ